MKKHLPMGDRHPSLRNQTRCGCALLIRPPQRVVTERAHKHIHFTRLPPRMSPGRSNSPAETLGDYSRTEAVPLTPQLGNASGMPAPHFSPRQQHNNLRVASGSNNSLGSLSMSHGDRIDRHGLTPPTSNTGNVRPTKVRLDLLGRDISHLPPFGRSDQRVPRAIAPLRAERGAVEVAEGGVGMGMGVGIRKESRQEREK